MIKEIEIEEYKCVCSPLESSDTIIYMIYPDSETFSNDWLEKMTSELKVSLAVVYLPEDKWNEELTPWSEPKDGAKGSKPFDGDASDFLKILQGKIVPESLKTCNLPLEINKDLMGVSLGGLFTLWQWLISDTFRSIACLSGSFWYEGFLNWFESLNIPSKSGKAYFLLGEEEPKSKVKAFKSVGVNTETIVKTLQDKGIDVKFDWVPGNHFSNPVQRATLALKSLLNKE